MVAAPAAGGRRLSRSPPLTLLAHPEPLGCCAKGRSWAPAQQRAPQFLPHSLSPRRSPGMGTHWNWRPSGCGTMSTTHMSTASSRARPMASWWRWVGRAGRVGGACGFFTGAGGEWVLDAAAQPTAWPLAAAQAPNACPPLPTRCSGVPCYSRGLLAGSWGVRSAAACAAATQVPSPAVAGAGGAPPCCSRPLSRGGGAGRAPSCRSECGDDPEYDEALMIRFVAGSA